MIVGLAGSPANQLSLASDSMTVDVQVLPYVAVAGAVAGIWLFFKLLELLRRLLIPLVLGAVIVVVGQSGMDWPFSSAGATGQQVPAVEPMGEFLPPR